VLGDLIVDAQWWSELTQRAGALVDAMHQAHPDRSGLELTEFRSSLVKLPPGAADVLVSDLCRTGFALAGTCLKRAAHLPALPPPLHAEGARIRAALAAQPLAPPARKELAAAGAAWQALRFLLQAGEVVEISSELVMSAGAVQLARDRVRQFVRAKGPATASELREMLGTNRRVIIPLLEWLDREGVTRRIGDKRVLKPE
jgi:selenocysteine-specific elongation factor